MGAEGEGTVARTYNKWAILFTVIAMTFMVCLDTSIVNVALPVMAAELGVKMADIEWVATAYMLVSCAGMLVCGRLGDIYGKVRVFQVGVVLFTLGSALCGFAPNLPVLIASRALQGLGGAAAFSCNQGILHRDVPCERARTRTGMAGDGRRRGIDGGPRHRVGCFSPPRDGARFFWSTFPWGSSRSSSA